MIRYNVTGNERKKLVKKLSELVGERAAYQGMPTMAFKIGEYTVDKEGTVSPDPTEDIIRALSRAGFDGEKSEAEEATPDPIGLIINIPLEKLTEKQIENFENMAKSKGELIKQAFGIDDLPVEENETDLRIRWFENMEPTAELSKTATEFVSAMLEKAGKQRHVSANPVPTDNPRYNFRVFLNALGFLGDEHKEIRKALLKNLPGNSAFRHMGVTA